MPVNDELFERVRVWKFQNLDRFETHQLLEELAAALRAALAAQPQPDPRDGIIARLLAGWHPNDNEPFWSKWRTFQATGEFEPMTDAERAYLAVAGSATPTGDNE